MAIWNDYNWKFWDPKTEPLPEEPEKFRKISLCTNCMNRTYDLKKTFIQNIIHNQDYPNVEFVLLNYNSKDDMDEWVKQYLMGWIEDGTVVYYKTTEPEFYEMGHSRNVAFKLATGDIVNNVDADNYTNQGFAAVLNRMAEVAPKEAIFAKGKRMMHGRFGMYRDEFLQIGGYDEELTGYGFDDHNVLYRAMALGKKFMWWGHECPMDRIKTPRSEVGKNMKEKSWKKTERINKDITMKKLESGVRVVNEGHHWGKATVIKNFKEEISI